MAKLRKESTFSDDIINLRLSLNIPWDIVNIQQISQFTN